MPERREPTVGMAQLKVAAEGKARAGAEVQNLRACLVQLQEAMRIEGIDPQGPLGVWSRALASTISSLAIVVEVQAELVEGKAETVERAMMAQVKRVEVGVEELRAWTNRAKAEIEDSKERRRADNLALAKELGENVKETLKNSLLIRERKWNRRQNWTAATLLALLLSACFVGGATWREQQRPTGTVQEVMDRCLARQVLDEVTHQYFCPVKIVQGKL